MKKIGIVDVRTRLRNIPDGDVNYARAETFREQAERAIQSKFPSRIIFCIESGIGDPSASMPEDSMMNLLEALADVGTASQVEKYGHMIMKEYTSKTRDAQETLKYMKQRLGRAKSKVTTKIQNNFDDLWQATNSTIGTAKDNFKKNTEPYKNAIANAKTRAKKAGETAKKAISRNEDALISVYESIVEAAKEYVTIDRILENYNRVSKRFNIDRIIQENTVINGVPDTCTEICNLIETYDMPVKARYNTCLETIWYGLHKNGFIFDEQELVTTVTDFYMAKGGNSFACKSILEASVVFDKGDYMGDIDVITEEEPEEEPIQESKPVRMDLGLQKSLFSEDIRYYRDVDSYEDGNISKSSKTDGSDTQYTSDRKTSLIRNPFEAIAHTHPEKINNIRLEAIASCNNVIESFNTFFDDLFEDMSKHNKEVMDSFGGLNMKKSQQGISWIVEIMNRQIEALKKAEGVSTQEAYRIVKSNFIPESLTEDGCRALINIRISKNRALTMHLKTMLEANYQFLNLTEAEANELISNLDNPNLSSQAISTIKQIISKKKNLRNFTVKDGVYDFRNVGGGCIFCSPIDADNADMYYNSKPEKRLPDIFEYDAIVYTHGSQNKQDNAQSFANAVLNSINKIEQVISKEYKEQSGFDKQVSLISGEDVNNINQYLKSNSSYTATEYIDKFLIKPREELYKLIMDFVSNMKSDRKNAIKYYNDFLDDLSDFNDAHLMIGQLNNWCNWVRKQVKGIHPTWVSSYANGDNSGTWTMNSINTLQANGLNTMPELIRQLKSEGFKSILLTTCNPGSVKLPDDIANDKSITIYMGNHSVYKEFYTPLDNQFDRIITALDEHVDNLLARYKIDPYDLAPIGTLVEEYNALNEAYIREGALDVLQNIARKAVEIIVTLWKNLIKFLKFIADKIKKFIFGSEEGSKKELSKPVQVTTISVSGGKPSVVTANAKTQEEAKKIASDSCNKLESLVKRLSDKETSEIKKIQNAIDQGKVKKDTSKNNNSQQSSAESYIAKITDYQYMVEGKLSAKERKNIKDSDYGIPSKRKYPMPDESHVRSAIQMFNHVDSADEAELARNIKKKIKKYGMSVSVGKENRFSKYYKAANETATITSDIREYASHNSGYPIVEEDESKIDFNKILNDYKVSNDSEKEHKLKALVLKLYKLPPEQVIEGTPNLLRYIRGILIIGGFAINPILGIVAFIADQIVAMHMKREESAKMREIFKEEIRKTDKKIESTKSTSQKDNLQKYRDALVKAYTKIDEYYEALLTDKELDDKYDAADDTDIKSGSFGDSELDNFEDMFGDEFDFDDEDFDDMDGFEESGKFIPVIGKLLEAYDDCKEKSFDQHKCRKIIKMSPSIVGSLANVANEYPSIISKRDLLNAIDDVRSDIQVGSIRVNMIERYELNNTYDEIMRSDDTVIKHGDIFSEAKSFATQIKILRALNEIYSSCVYYSPLTEASFTNSLKIAGEKLKKAMTKVSDADRNISHTIDSSLSSFTRSAERAMTNDRRDAIIKGSVIPSASKIIKGAILAGASSIVLGPTIAVIGVLGYLGVSKKLNDRQRKALLDEIEIELKMCQKYIDLAESKNDLKSLKKLYSIQRELQKQRGKIKYRIGLKGERYVEPEKFDPSNQ